MTWKATARALVAADKKRQRQEHLRLRDMDRRSKERAKSSALEQARLEVEAHEDRIEALLSVHRETSEPWDWSAIAVSLPPPSPQKQQQQELRAKQIQIMAAARFPGFSQRGDSAGIEAGRLEDEGQFQQALKSYEEDVSNSEEKRVLANRILAGDVIGFREAIADLSPLAELSDLGTVVRLVVHNTSLVECAITVSGTTIIPKESKTLTATGKVSVRPMPKARSHEIFQDFVCGCVLRVAREVFALLPVKGVLVTASVSAVDGITGHQIELPVLSVNLARVLLDRLDFAQVDASDALDNFPHKGDVKASRKTGAFVTISPLTPDDVPSHPSGGSAYATAISQTQQLREVIRSEAASFASLTQSTRPA